MAIRPSRGRTTRLGLFALGVKAPFRAYPVEQQSAGIAPQSVADAITLQVATSVTALLDHSKHLGLPVLGVILLGKGNDRLGCRSNLLMIY